MYIYFKSKEELLSETVKFTYPGTPLITVVGHLYLLGCNNYKMYVGRNRNLHII